MHPDLADRVQYIGRLTDQQRMITVRDSPVVGPMIDIVAERVGSDGECFVDLRAEPGPDGIPFAGEEALQSLVVPPPAADAPPEAVLAEMAQAIKTADRDRYDTLFATWQSWSEDGQSYYDAGTRPGRPRWTRPGRSRGR